MDPAEKSPLLEHNRQKTAKHAWMYPVRLVALGLALSAVVCTFAYGGDMLGAGGIRSRIFAAGDDAKHVEPTLIWTSVDKDYVIMACNWLRSVAVHIGAEATQDSVYLFVDGEETKARMEKCGPSVNYVLPDRVAQAWADQAPDASADAQPEESSGDQAARLGGEPNLLVGLPKLGADVGSKDYKYAVFQKVFQAKAAVQIARETGKRYVIQNDGDTAWVRDARTAIPENLELIAAQNDLGDPDRYKQDVMRPNGDQSVSDGQVYCVGVLFYNALSPKIDDFIKQWKERSQVIFDAGGTMVDQASYGDLCGQEEFHCGMLNPRLVADGWMLIQGDWNDFHTTITIGHADYIGGYEGKVGFLKAWGMWYMQDDEQL